MFYFYDKCSINLIVINKIRNRGKMPYPFLHPFNFIPFMKLHFKKYSSKTLLSLKIQRIALILIRLKGSLQKIYRPSCWKPATKCYFKMPNSFCYNSCRLKIWGIGSFCGSLSAVKSMFFLQTSFNWSFLKKD